MASSFKSNYAGVGDMLTSGFMQAEMRRRAGRVLAEAEATAPVGDESDGEPHFKDSFELDSGVQHHATSRAYGRVRSTDPDALWIELGTEDTPRHRTLGKALHAAK